MKNMSIFIINKLYTLKLSFSVFLMFKFLFSTCFDYFKSKFKFSEFSNDCLSNYITNEILLGIWTNFVFSTWNNFK